MADEKRYFSVKDMFEQAVTRAKTDPRYEEYSKICELDYDLLCSTCKYDKLYRCWSSHVELFSYSDFDTYDKNNRYRLMDMSARDCNRDGAALRFVAEKLSKQTSEVKILMIICDGQPNDDGYSGSAAEADLRGIKLEYARKGVKIYAAAIGEDRPRIERIYGDGYLDITNLQELPVMLTNLIVRSLPH